MRNWYELIELMIDNLDWVVFASSIVLVLVSVIKNRKTRIVVPDKQVAVV